MNHDFLNAQILGVALMPMNIKKKYLEVVHA